MGWRWFLSDELGSENTHNIYKFLSSEYQDKDIFPEMENIFASLRYFDPIQTKVVIMGQDPYHIPWVANGLAFSISNGKLPHSLINIYKEICSEYDLNYIDYKNNLTWNLSGRAKQWVLLLNNCLTVEAHKPLSHSKIWWQKFTDWLISQLSNEYSGIVFLLLWSLAHSKWSLVNCDKHLVLNLVHPSPLSANRWFFGCNCFLDCNDFLKNNWKIEIKWI